MDSNPDPEFVIYAFARDVWNLNRIKILLFPCPEIIKLVALFFGIEDFFKYFNENWWIATNNGKTITKNRGINGTVYGSKVISYDSNSIYKWTIKINKGNIIWIGIDEGNHK
eukprot:204643_1